MPIERLPFEQCNATRPGWTATFQPSHHHPQFRLTSDWATARLFWANGRWLLIGGDAPEESESWSGPEDGTVDARPSTLADLLGQHEERISGFVLREEALRLRERAVEQREEQVRRSWQALDAALLFDVNDVMESLERRLADDGFSPDTYRRLLVLRDAQKLQARDAEVPHA